MKVAFVSDSGTGLSVEEIEKLGCYSVPLQISYDGINLLENEDTNVDEVYELMQSGKMMKTSLAPLGVIEALFIRLKEAGYDMIFAVPICSGLSGTIDAMEMVAREVGIQFDYFDSYCTVMVERYMLVRAKELYEEEGKSIEEIKAIFTKICDSTNTLLVPDDLQHLKRGGRLTPFAATLGGLLKIKPILEINKRTKGKIDVLDKVRTMSRALDRTVDVMKREILGTGEGYSITVAHVVAEEAARALLKKYQDVFPKATYQVIKLVSVVGVHTGIGCLAIQYFQKL